MRVIREGDFPAVVPAPHVEDPDHPNGSAYHQGNIEGEAGIMSAMSVDLAFPGGILPRSGSRMDGPEGGRGPATAWEGWDEALAGGPVRHLSTDRIKITDRGISIVEAHSGRFGPDKANSIMVDRLRQISRGELQATDQDLNFYSHEIREYVRYRRVGWPTGVPADSEAAMNLWRQTHSGTLADYGLTLQSDALLYHSDALPFIGEVP